MSVLVLVAVQVDCFFCCDGKNGPLVSLVQGIIIGTWNPRVLNLSLKAEEFDFVLKLFC